MLPRFQPSPRLINEPTAAVIIDYQLYSVY